MTATREKAIGEDAEYLRKYIGVLMDSLRPIQEKRVDQIEQQISKALGNSPSLEDKKACYLLLLRTMLPGMLGADAALVSRIEDNLCASGFPPMTEMSVAVANGRIRPLPKSAQDLIEVLETSIDLETLVKCHTMDDTMSQFAVQYLREMRFGIWFRKVLPPDFGNRPNSYLGGIPSLRNHSEWPYDSRGLRAFFVGQLDCATISSLIPGHYPENGILHFFMDQDGEAGWSDNGRRKCFLVYQDALPENPIDTVPSDYPTGGDWLSPIEGSSWYLRELEPREIQPRIWPRTDIQAVKVATFPSMERYCDDLPLVEHQAESRRNLRRAVSDVLLGILNAYETEKRALLCGPSSRKERKRFLIPKTVPSSLRDYKEKEYLSYGSGFPWSRLHISRTIESIRTRIRDELDRGIRSFPIDFKETLELEQRFRNHYSWGYGGIRRVPNLVTQSPEFDALWSMVRTKYPDSFSEFQRWIVIEHFYQEASDLFEQFVDCTWDAPNSSQKTAFVDWLASWTNFFSAAGDSSLKTIIDEKQLPMRIDFLDACEADKLGQARHGYSKIARDIHSACEAAIFDATVLSIGHSGDILAQIPPELRNLVVEESDLQHATHKSLGYGNNVQRAAHDERNSVLLLEVVSDKSLFTNFGDGALQFWIRSEDLSDRRFNEAYMTAECT